MKIFKISVLIFSLFLVGCSRMNAYQYKRQTAQVLHNDCKVEDMTILNQSSIYGNPLGAYFWYAQCNSKTYYCTQTPETKCNEASVPKEIITKY